MADDGVPLVRSTAATRATAAPPSGASTAQPPTAPVAAGARQQQQKKGSGTSGGVSNVARLPSLKSTQAAGTTTPNARPSPVVKTEPISITSPIRTISQATPSPTVPAHEAGAASSSLAGSSSSPLSSPPQQVSLIQRLAAASASANANKPKFAPVIPTERRKRPEPAPTDRSDGTRKDERRDRHERGRGRGWGREQGGLATEGSPVAAAPVPVPVQAMAGRGKGVHGRGNMPFASSPRGRPLGRGKGKERSMFFPMLQYEDYPEDDLTAPQMETDLNAPLMLTSWQPSTSSSTPLHAKAEAMDVDRALLAPRIKPDPDLMATSTAPTLVEDEEEPMDDEALASNFVGDPAAKFFRVENGNLICDKNKVFFFQFPVALPMPGANMPTIKTGMGIPPAPPASSSSGLSASASGSVAFADIKQHTANVDGDVAAVDEKSDGIDADLAATDDFKSHVGHMSEGRLGKLTIHRSGKIKLKMGDYVFDLTAGTDCHFLQQMAVIQSDEERMVVLGQVHKRFIATPSFEDLINRPGGY